MNCIILGFESQIYDLLWTASDQSLRYGGHRLVRNVGQGSARSDQSHGDGRPHAVLEIKNIDDGSQKKPSEE